MTLASNIKGYINGEEWGIVEPSPLLSYNSIINTAYHIVDECTGDIIFIVDFDIDSDGISILDILNEYPLNYYNKFNNEGRITNRILGAYGPQPTLFYGEACEGDFIAIYYISSSNKRAYYHG